MARSAKKYLKISKGQISKNLVERTDIGILDDSGQEITNFYNTKYGALQTVAGTEFMFNFGKDAKVKLHTIHLSDNKEATLAFDATNQKLYLFDYQGNQLDQISFPYITGENKYQEIKLNDVLYYNESNQEWEYYLRYASETLLMRKYKRSPYHIFHWGRIADMPYSVGVALKALPALKRLNSFIKANLELIPFQFPMFLTTAGNVLSKNLTFKPGGFLTIRDMQGFQPLTLGSNRSDFKLELQTEEIAIKETFLDSTLPSVPRDMTAAEVNARITPYGETANVNISLLTDVMKNIGWDIFDEVFNREIAGTVNFTLEDMHELLDCTINNDATMDNNLIQKITGYIQNVSFDPQAIWQALDRNKTLEKLARAWNVPVEITRTADEITKAQQADAQAQAQAVQQAENAQMRVDANKEQSKAMAKLIEQQGNA